MRSANLCCYLLLAVLAFSAGTASAQASSYEELQAAYLYNFAKYIKWPGEHESFNIGIVGSDERLIEILGGVLKGKRVGGKNLTVTTVSEKDSLKSFHLLYIPAQHSRLLEATLENIGASQVLVVTERDLVKKGATISFLVHDNKLRFKVNVEALQKAGVVASEGLLKLAILD